MAHDKFEKCRKINKREFKGKIEELQLFEFFNCITYLETQERVYFLHIW